MYLTSAILTLASFLFFAFVPLPRAYYPEIIFHRPEEFLPAFFFLVALVVKTLKEKQEVDFPIILLVPSSMDLPSIAEQVPQFDDHITVCFDRETLIEKIAGLSIRPPEPEDLLASA